MFWRRNEKFESIVRCSYFEVLVDLDVYIVGSEFVK